MTSFKNIPKFLLYTIIIFMLFAVLYTILSKNYSGPKHGINYQNQGVEIFTNSQGLPALATGNCNTDSDCFPSGCSQQICANHEVVTTCELINFPEKETYTCGCINNRCVWYR